jgi:hypothetical protein
MSPARTNTTLILGASLALVMLATRPAAAQLNGENLLGDNGVKSGTQAAPGFYLSSLYFRSYTDTIKNAKGDRITFDPSQPANQTVNVIAPVFTYVSKGTIFGAHYGAMAVIPFANGELEAPAFGLTQTVSGNLTDVYIVPAQLGWHTSRADITTAFGFFAPTGKYTPGASDNLGKGMWSYEVSGGSTVYLDQKRSWSVATTAYWETHTKKDGTTDLAIGPATLTGIRVGQLMTLEGGAAKSFMHGAAHFGAAYYAQWKITPDDFGVTIPGAPEVGKHRVFGIGPDVTIPIATKSTLISLVNIRYFWEAGAEAKTQGQSLVMTMTFPVPGIKIPAAK